MKFELYNEDCLTGMDRLADESVDMILCDLPYGTTRNKWDSIIPLEPLWKQYKRVIKPHGAIVLTAQVPFNIVLGASNLSWLRYEWIWDKSCPTGFLNAKKMPLKSHENIMVFYRNLPTYNPQMTPGKPYTAKRGGRSSNYGKDRIDGQSVITANGDGLRYPTDVLEFQRQQRNIHPTQKPVPLFEYLIRTYTNPGKLVLDNAFGSGTTAIACHNADRNFIGFELDAGYFLAASQRINDHINTANINDLFEDVERNEAA